MYTLYSIIQAQPGNIHERVMLQLLPCMSKIIEKAVHHRQ